MHKKSRGQLDWSLSIKDKGPTRGLYLFQIFGVSHLWVSLQ